LIKKLYECKPRDKVKRTLGALRAHKTRSELAIEKARTAAERKDLAAKVADYERRIAVVIAARG
jgi:hypothetical protein